MERRRRWLGYVAIGVGMLALVVALGGRAWGLGSRGRGDGQQARGAVAPQSVPQPAQAPQAAPQRQQSQGDAQGSDQRVEAGRAGRGAGERDGRLPFGHGLIEGIGTLVGGLLLGGLGLFLLRPHVGQRLLRAGRAWRTGQHSEADWHTTRASAPPSDTRATPPTVPALPQTPPTAPYTGETTRFYDF